jgi:hypothetical protein
MTTAPFCDSLEKYFVSVWGFGKHWRIVVQQTMPVVSKPSTEVKHVLPFEDLLKSHAEPDVEIMTRLGLQRIEEVRVQWRLAEHLQSTIKIQL